jgi:Transposase IS116/IS110/IS902 family
MAAIASRWLLEKAFDRLLASCFFGTHRPTRNCSFRHFKSNLPQFTVNARCTPGGILSHHLKISSRSLPLMDRDRQRSCALNATAVAAKSSGGQQRLGAISKQVNRLMRSLLVEVAQITFRYDPGSRKTLMHYFPRIMSLSLRTPQSSKYEALVQLRLLG